MRKLLPYLGAGVALAGLVIGMIKCGDSLGAEDRAMRAEATARPSLASVAYREAPAKPMPPMPARVADSAPEAPAAVMARLAEVMSPTGRTGRIDERGSRLIHYADERIAGWNFNLATLRSNPRSRWLELSAPSGEGINTLHFGDATTVCSHYGPGGAQRMIYELTGLPGVFMDRSLMPGEVRPGHVHLYNLEYLRGEAYPFSSAHSCLAEKGRL